MATKVKPSRLQITGTPQAWDVPMYVDQDTFQWWAWWGAGDVTWPASSTDWDVVLFDWATWKLIKDSGVTLWTAASKDTWTSSWNVPVLDSSWKLATSTLPWVALTDTFTVSTSSDLTSLSSAEQGDLAIVTTESKTYVLSAEPYSTAANWKEILSPTGWVTSVNWQTWAVTVAEVPSWWTDGQILSKVSGSVAWANAPESSNTKTFYLSSTSDLTTAQAAYDWYSAGKNPIIVYNNKVYTLYYWWSGWIFLSYSGATNINVSNTSYWDAQIWINCVDWEVTSINTYYSYQYFLATNENYTTPYTPLYDWSPATKKYVDDKQKTITVTLTSAWWSSSTQTVSATGVTASNTVICSPAPSSISDYTNNW
jgi:hypothetical protein